MINIDRELKQDFETFCKKNYPRFTYESNIGNKRQWFYLEAGHIFEGWVHYEFFEGKVHLHIEKPDTPNLFNPKQLHEFIQKKNKSNKIQGIQNEVEQVKDTMKNNIKNMYNNVEDVEIMEKKANELREGAEEYNNQAVKLKRTTWWQNCKWWIILIVVIILLLVILLPVIFRRK